MLATKELLIFKTIVEVESFTGAGRRLSLSQSAISQHMRALERQVGRPLLSRVGHRVRLTPAGEVLLGCAEQVLGKIDEAQRALAEDGEGRGGVLRMGTSGAACHHLLPRVLKEFRDRFPKLALQVTSGHSRLTVTRIVSRELDLGLITLPVEAKRLRITQLGRDELIAIVPPLHPWAGRRRVQAGAFVGQPLVLYERHGNTTDLILRFLLEEGVFPRVAMEIDHLEAMKEMVRIGLGVAIVPQWAVRKELTDGVLAPVTLGKTGLSRAWGLAYLEHPQQPATLKAFVRLCLERLPSLLSASRAPKPAAG